MRGRLEALNPVFDDTLVEADPPVLAQSADSERGSTSVAPSQSATSVAPSQNAAVAADITSEQISYAGSGLIFNNQYGAGVTPAYRSAIIAAENFFQTHFTNSVTVNMSFDLQQIDPKFSGENTPGPGSTVTVSYATLKNALSSHATTSDDIASVKSLPSSDPSNGRGFTLAMGLAEALGLWSGGLSTLTDTVVLNSSLPWSYGADAVGVLEHEISEWAMGRVGGLGIYNNSWDPMDLFRYSSAGVHDYTGRGDGLNTYFSVDGISLLTELHNSVNTSGHYDKFDFADWDHTIGDAFGPGGPGSPGTVSATDLRVMDVLGWQPDIPTGPPIIAIAGTAAHQHVSAGTSISPFTNASITDSNAGQTETVTVTLSAPANGTVSNLGGAATILQLECIASAARRPQ